MAGIVRYSAVGDLFNLCPTVGVNWGQLTVVNGGLTELAQRRVLGFSEFNLLLSIL